MCGITGIFSPYQISLSKIFDMNSIQKHRGPDGEGYVFFSSSSKPKFQSNKIAFGSNQYGYLALGHNRLSVIDTTQAAEQPMTCQDSRYWIAYNGEIYNFLEIRDELNKLGYEFKTKSDTEVVLLSFIEWYLG